MSAPNAIVTATNAKKNSSAKAAKAENGAHTLVITARRITKPMMRAMVDAYAALTPDERAQRVAAEDDDTLVAVAYIARCAANARSEEKLQAEALADKLLAKAKKTLDGCKARSSLKHAIHAARECIVILHVQVVKRNHPGLPPTLLQALYNGPTHPVGPLHQPMPGLKATDNLAALNKAKNCFFVFVPDQPQSDEVNDDDLDWSWTEVRVCAISNGLACVQPLLIDGKASFPGSWGPRKMIGVPLRDDTPLLYVMPPGYDHSRRDEYMRQRIAAAAAEGAQA